MLNDLYTAQGKQLSGTPWDTYPRPQLRRESYVNLNGKWKLTVDGKAYPITVPFCPESLLSGVKRHFPEGATLCYSRRFRLPENFNRGRVLLHVGAADQRAAVLVNGQHLRSHVGGYTAFTVDITDALQDQNLLEIRCTDDLTDKTMPYGKQTLKRGGMWYTPVSGIWQSVWLESVPEHYIEALDIRVDTRQAVITVSPALDGTVICCGKEYSLVDGKAVVAPDNIRLWSPEDPYLYDFTVITDSDRVDSYFALRTIESKVVDGIPRLCLNGKPYFFHGLLDQGYWPDGIYTPAAPECYAEDIAAMKRLGFNTLRKHIKVEPEEFYYQCDKLGMVVFQDMVNNGSYSFWRDTALPTLGVQKRDDRKLHKGLPGRRMFLDTMTETVDQLKNHPCILYWTIFNEGWGQFDSAAVYEQLRKLDDSRIIDATSGWFRQERSDVDSRHIYFSPWSSLQLSEKPLVLSEFGGYACPVKGHLFNTGKSYGYKACKDTGHFQESLEKLYRQKVLPAIARGLCAAICTQVSDVEDEINGMVTYDRQVCKADENVMQQLAADLQQAIIP